MAENSEAVAEVVPDVQSDMPWPEIADDDLDSVYRLFCETLEPIGNKRRAEQRHGEVATVIMQPRWLRFGIGDPSVLDGVYRMEDMLETIKWGFNDVIEELERASVEKQSKTDGELDTQFENLPPRPGEVPPFRASVVFVERSNLDEAEWCSFPKVVSVASDGTCSPERKIKLVALPDRRERFRTIGQLLGLDHNPAILCISEYAPVPHDLEKLLQESVPAVPSLPAESITSSRLSLASSGQASGSVVTQIGGAGSGSSDSDKTIKADQSAESTPANGLPENGFPEDEDLLFMAPLRRQERAIAWASSETAMDRE